MKTHRKTVCNRDCPDACGLVATVEDGRVVKLRGDPDHPVTRGFLCYRTALFLERQYSADRLTTPLVRRGDRFEPIEWDAALDLCAERLTRIREQDGPAAVLHYRSGGSLGMLGHVVDHFFQKWGPVTSKRGDICAGAGSAAQMADFGESDSNDLFGLNDSRSVVMWGKNVLVSSPHLVPILKSCRSKGARLVLVDPVHHRTADLCDATVQPRPGGDFALAMAVARILFDEGWADPDAARICDGWDGFRALASTRTVNEWCAQADASPDDALLLARCLGRERPSAILVGWGMGRRPNGAGIVRALDALCTISGNLGVPGGGVSFYFKRRGAFDLSFASGAPARTLAEPLLGSQILGAKDPPIRAVWVTAANPVTMLPDSRTTAEALRTRDFVVVADSFLTDTAKLATLVLPTTTLLEADDLVGSYGHHWLGAVTPVVAPPRGVRSDLEIIRGLASRVGLGTAFDADARAWKKRIVAGKLGPTGIDLERLEQGPVRNPLAPEVLFAGGKVPTRSGRVQLVTEEPPSDPPLPGFPLLLMSLSHLESQCSQWARPPEGPLVATVHPGSAAGLPDGAPAWIESPIGRLEVRLHHDPRQRRDVVIVPKGGHLEDGRCANALIRARTTDHGEGGVLYEWVRIVATQLHDGGR